MPAGGGGGVVSMFDESAVGRVVSPQPVSVAIMANATIGRLIRRSVFTAISLRLRSSGGPREGNPMKVTKARVGTAITVPAPPACQGAFSCGLTPQSRDGHPRAR